MRPISKPTGYYKDERGREYYWDGRQRSYIPENPYRQFKSDMGRAAPWVVVALSLPVIVPVVIVLVALLLWALWALFTLLLFPINGSPFDLSL